MLHLLKKSTMYLLKLVIQLTGFIICVLISFYMNPYVYIYLYTQWLGPTASVTVQFMCPAHVTFPSGLYVHTNTICNLCVWLSFWNITILCRYEQYQIAQWTALTRLYSGPSPGVSFLQGSVESDVNLSAMDHKEDPGSWGGGIRVVGEDTWRDGTPQTK